MTELHAQAISARLSRIRASVKTLMEASAKGREAFHTDSFPLAAAQWHYQLAVQTALDIADHIIASEDWEVADTDADAFHVLGKHAVLSHELTERLASLARLRNILVHSYLEVDPGKLYDDIGGGIKHLESFCQAIVKFLDSQT